MLKVVGSTAKTSLEEKVDYPEDNLKLKAPVSIDADLLNTGETVLLKARIKTKVESECSRCLLKFDMPLEFEFEEEYSKNTALPNSNKKEVELTDKDFIFKMEKDNTIDLSEVVRQNILTQLPIKTLCNECSKSLEGG